MDKIERMILKNPPKPKSLKNFEQEIIDRCTTPYIFRYKDGKCYCNHCHKHFSSNKNEYRTLTYAKQQRLYDVATSSHGFKVVCPECGADAIVFDGWRGRKKLDVDAYVNVAIPARDGAVFVRCFLINIDYNISDDPYITYSEDKRIYINTDQQRYYKRNIYSYTEPYYGEKNCMYCNLNNINSPHEFYEIKECKEPKYPTHNLWQRPRQTIYIGFGNGTLKKTNLKYCDIEDFYFETHNNRFIKFLSLFAKYPVIEKFLKEGFYNLVDTYVRAKNGDGLGYPQSMYYNYKLINWRATTVKRAIKNINDKYKNLKELGDPTYRDIFIENESQKIKCKNEDKKYIEDFYIFGKFEILEYLIKFMSPHKVFKYFEGQKDKCKGVTGSDLPTRFYKDYLKMQNKLGVKLDNKAVLFPSNLKTAHDSALDRLNEIKFEEEKRKNKIKEMRFKEKLAYYQEHYSFSANGLFISPYENTKDLYDEGQQLNICIYRCYKDAYFNGDTILLKVRRESEPDKPFVAVEMSHSKTIVQCRGESNSKPPEEVKEFMELFKQFLKNQKSENKRRAS